MGGQAQSAKDFLHRGTFPDQLLKRVAGFGLLFQDGNFLVVQNKGGEVGERPDGSGHLTLLVSDDRDIAIEVDFSPIFGQNLALLVADSPGIGGRIIQKIRQHSKPLTVLAF